jgi:phosphoglycerate dehydrogenase-like enzyme
MYVRDNQLSNLVMTPHLSGWTSGTVLRRQQTIAEKHPQPVGNEAPLNVISRSLNGLPQQDRQSARYDKLT